jgi:hypothetical protein
VVEGVVLLPVATCVAVLVVVVEEVGVLFSAEAVSVVDSAELTVTGVEVTEADGVQQERYEVVGTYVPVWPAHPGTLVLGGARPPPQSSGSQISPVFGSNQWTMPSSQVVKLWVEQPAKTIFANTSSDATVERNPLILLIWYCVVRTGAV